MTNTTDINSYFEARQSVIRLCLFHFNIWSAFAIEGSPR